MITVTTTRGTQSTQIKEYIVDTLLNAPETFIILIVNVWGQCLLCILQVVSKFSNHNSVYKFMCLCCPGQLKLNLVSDIIPNIYGS